MKITNLASTLLLAALVSFGLVQTSLAVPAPAASTGLTTPVLPREEAEPASLAAPVKVANLGPVTITVNNTADNGPGTLRQAILDAVSGDTINFALPLPATIVLTNLQLRIDKSITITGPGAKQLTVQRSTNPGTPNFRLIRVPYATNIVQISGLTLHNGRVVTTTDGDNLGGAIYNTGQLTLSGCDLIGNIAPATNAVLGGFGGGVFTVGPLVMDHCNVSSNNASGAGGGINLYPSSRLTLTDSTVAGNYAGQQAGGINVQGSIAFVQNCTISGNIADGPGAGGGIVNLGYSGETSRLVLDHCTITRNTGLAYNGGLTTYGYAGSGIISSELKSTIIAGNFGTNFITGGTLTTLSTHGHNLDSDGTSLFTNGFNGDIIGSSSNIIDALLGPLQNNGGPTPTHALLASSPALDAGACDFDGNPVTKDQRGINRPQGPACDIGAHENEGGYLQFTTTAWSVGEAGGTIQLTVTRMGGSAGTVTVQCATINGTATAGADFTSIASNLSFAPGETSKSFVVTINDDVLLEGDETFRVVLSNPQGDAILGTSTNAVVTIIDNELDSAGTLQFSLGAYSVSEAEPSAPITITRTGGTSSNVFVLFKITAGTAIAGTHYLDVRTNLNFTPGLTNIIVNIPVINNSTVNGNKFLTLELSSPSIGTSLGSNTSVLTIIDDDVGGSVQFSLAAYSLSETGGLATITVTRTGGFASGVTVRFETQNGSATAGLDYTAVFNNLVFAANQVSKTVLIPVLNDSLAEGNETVQLTLRNPGGGATLGVISNAVLTIIDDKPTLEFVSTTFTTNEAGSTAVFAVVRTGNGANTVTVNFATEDGTALAGPDYKATNGTLTFGPNVFTQNVTITIINDTLVEADEIFSVNLTNAVDAILGSSSNAVVTILDNDLGGIIQFSAIAYTNTEAGPAASIIVTRTGGAASGVSVDFDTMDLTATADEDYTPVSSTLVFAANEVSQTVLIPVLTDLLPEGNETVQLTLRNPGGGATLGVISSAVLTIIDNAPTLQFVSTTFTKSEAGSTAVLAVVRTGPGAGTVNVNFATEDGTALAGADYRATNGTLTFPANVFTQNVTITIINDTVVEADESFSVNLTSPSSNVSLGGNTEAVVTILDNDLGGIIQFSAGAYTNTEAGPAASIIVTRTGGAASGVSVRFETQDGTATAGEDYTAVSSTINFAVNEVSKTVLIPLLNDSLAEGNETVNLSLSEPTGGATLGPRSTSELTIIDNDVGGSVQFSLAAYSRSETGGLATITVTRTGGSASGVTVDFDTMDLTATADLDYTAVSATLVFASNQVSQTVLIPVLNDSLAEGNEAVQLTLRNPGGGATLGVISNAVLTIIDDEIMIQFVSTTFTNSEAGPTVILTVARTGPAAAAGSVQFNTVNGSAISTNDYKGTNGTVTFAANVLTKTITIPIVNDPVVEGDEIFSVTLSNPSTGFQLGSSSNATVTILDNDLGGIIQFSAITYTITEAGPAASIIVTRTGGAASGVSVRFETQNGTATAGADYTAVSSTINFAANEVTKTVLIPIVNDNFVEGNETVNLSLSAPIGGATLGTRSTSVLTITGR